MKHLYNAMVQKPATVTATANAMMKLGFFRNFLPHFRLLQSPYSTSTSSSSIKKNNDVTKANISAFSVFLEHSMGFSNLQSKDVASKLANDSQIEATKKKVRDFNNLCDNAISVVSFFKKLGFLKPKIKDILCNEPRVLLSSVEDSLSPKIKMLKELGFSDVDVNKIVFMNPNLLCNRLDTVIDAFRSVMASEKEVIRCLKRRMYVRGAVNLVQNVELLRNSYGIPIEKIRKIFARSHGGFVLEPDSFRELLVKVEEKFGIPRESKMFVYGVQLVLLYSDELLEKKRAMIMSYGWSESQVSALFRRNPFCLNISELLLKQKMDFLMKELGFTPDYLLTRVSLLTCSVENRLLPRHQVLQLLKKKGNTKCSLCSVSYLSEPAFMKRFVLPFEEVHELYAQLMGSNI